MAYDNIKNHKKAWLHPLTAKHMFEKAIREEGQIGFLTFLGLASKSAVFQ